MFVVSLNYLVGNGEQRLGDSQTERLCGLKIDAERELGRLDDRKIGRFLASEDAVDITSDTPERVGSDSPVGDEATTGDEQGKAVDGRQLVAGRKLDNQFAMNVRKRGARNDQAAVRAARECRHTALD